MPQLHIHVHVQRVIHSMHYNNYDHDEILDFTFINAPSKGMMPVNVQTQTTNPGPLLAYQAKSE